jgi:glucan 1,3-beta-glucosidase
MDIPVRIPQSMPRMLPVTFEISVINKKQIGFDIFTGGKVKEDQGVGAEAIIDAVATDVPIFLRSSKPSDDTLTGSVVLQNVVLKNSVTAVGVADAPDLLAGKPNGEIVIERWGQGHVYKGTSQEQAFVQGALPGGQVASCLLDRDGRVVSRSRPQYENYGVEQFVSVREYGAAGDGKTVRVLLRLTTSPSLVYAQDDTAALQKILDDVGGA